MIINRIFLNLLLVTTLVCICISQIKIGNHSIPNNKLVISMWGFNQEAVDEIVLEPFEKKYGVEIDVRTGISVERLNEMKSDPSSDIDMILLPEIFEAKGIAAGLFEPLDYTKIKNVENINDKAKLTIEDGYGLAYSMNILEIIVNPFAGIEINSWKDLWNPELKGKIAIPDIMTTYGPAVVNIASDKANVCIEKDNGKSAFKELEKLAPNIYKTYTSPEDLVSMFSKGKIIAAIAPDFIYENIIQVNSGMKKIIPEEGTYLNFNKININKNSKNKEIAYEFIDHILSLEVQEKMAKELGKSPVNKQVNLSRGRADNLVSEELLDDVQMINNKFINSVMDIWCDGWNKTINSNKIGHINLIR